MKKNAVLVFVAAALLFLIGIAGTAMSEDLAAKAPAKTDTLAAPGQTTAAATMSCSAKCPMFVDNNKDGICDSMAVHHKDGKCTMMEQCKKDGRCTGNCKNHAAANKAAMPEMKCDPTKCATMPGGCPMKAKAKSSTSSCPGSK